MVYEQQKPRVVTSIGVLVLNNDGEILLSRRGKEPFKGAWVLPSGFMQSGETAEQAAVREVYEETGLRIKLDRVYGIYSDPWRDPRHHTLSVYYVGHVSGGEASHTIEATESQFFGLDKLPDGEYAFDHKQILKDFTESPELKKFNK